MRPLPSQTRSKLYSIAHDTTVAVAIFSTIATLGLLTLRMLNPTDSIFHDRNRLLIIVGTAFIFSIFFVSAVFYPAKRTVHEAYLREIHEVLLQKGMSLHYLDNARQFYHHERYGILSFYHDRVTIIKSSSGRWEIELPQYLALLIPKHFFRSHSSTKNW